MNIAHVRKTFAAVAATSVLLITAACGSDSDTTEETSTEPTTSESSTETETEPAESSDSAEFAAGEYSATGSYQTPNGQESVDVSVTITDDGTITDVAVDGNATNGNSVQFQSQFASGIADEVVGQPIDEIEVDRVSGSSLTGGGFNQAIDEIISQAQA